MIREEKSEGSSWNEENRVFRPLTTSFCFNSRLICWERTGNVGSRKRSNDAIKSLDEIGNEFLFVSYSSILSSRMENLNVNKHRFAYL